MRKTHYIENGKPICGVGYAPMNVRTVDAWYAASHKCERCRKIIKIRTLCP